MSQDQDIANYKILRYKAQALPPRYIPMVYSKFLRSLRDENSYFKLIDSKAYFKSYHRYIESVLERPNAFIRLAALADDHDVILGWALLEENVLHYVYVNKENRKIGIAKSLIGETQVDTVTHLTNIGLQLWSKELPKAIFNPFL